MSSKREQACVRALAMAVCHAVPYDAVTATMSRQPVQRALIYYNINKRVRARARASAHRSARTRTRPAVRTRGRRNDMLAARSVGDGDG